MDANARSPYRLNNLVIIISSVAYAVLVEEVLDSVFFTVKIDSMSNERIVEFMGHRVIPSDYVKDDEIIIGKPV